MEENEIQEVVRAFKVYITKVIKHSAIDYIRKIKAKKYIEVALSDVIDSIVSLSSFDEGTFFDFDEIGKINFSNKRNEKAFNSLSEKEKKILFLLIDGYTTKEIARKLNMTPDNVYSSIYIARKKFKNRWEKE